jgi:uncharacterized protein (DUF983 family)
MNEDISKPTHKPNYFVSLFGCKCSRCRTGKMFTNGISISNKKNMAMPENCPACGQPMELEVGFYYGTGYVSYALTVAISVATFIAFWVIYGISIDDNSLYIYLVVNGIVLVLGLPYIMRLSRTLWLSFFVKYDPDWKSKEAEKPERIVKEHMGNW